MRRMCGPGTKSGDIRKTECSEDEKALIRVEICDRDMGWVVHLDQCAEENAVAAEDVKSSKQSSSSNNVWMTASVCFAAFFGVGALVIAIKNSLAAKSQKDQYGKLEDRQIET